LNEDAKKPDAMLAKSLILTFALCSSGAGRTENSHYEISSVGKKYN